MATTNANRTRRALLLGCGDQTSNDALDIITSVKVFDWLGYDVNLEAFYLPPGSEALTKVIGRRAICRTLGRAEAEALIELGLANLLDTPRTDMNIGRHHLLTSLSEASHSTDLTGALLRMGGVAVINGATADVGDLADFYEHTRRVHPDNYEEDE